MHKPGNSPAFLMGMEKFHHRRRYAAFLVNHVGSDTFDNENDLKQLSDGCLIGKMPPNKLPARGNFNIGMNFQRGIEEDDQSADTTRSP